MPPRVSLLLPLLAIGLCPLRKAEALDGIWINPGSSSWGAGFNWSSSTPPAGPGAQASFMSASASGGITVTLDGSRTVGSLVFDNQSAEHEWSVRSGGGGPLVLDNLTGIPLIRVNLGTALIGAEISGSKGFSKEGAGTLVLRGSNSLFGPLAVKEGSLRFGAPPFFPSGLKIMPLGDSITYGHDGTNAGYRGPLYSLLKPLAADFVYVGSSTERGGYLPPEQRHNEGHSSYTLQDTSNNLDGFDNTRFLEHGGAERNPNGGYWLTGGGSSGRPPLYPDIILMMLGTNDLPDPAGVDLRLNSLITKITTLRPNTKLFVAKIIPARKLPAAVASYNAIVETTVSNFKAAGANIHLVDLFTNFPANGLIWDEVHPNDNGFNWMAIQWHEAVIRAYSPEGGSSLATTFLNTVSVSQGATLDLHGTQSVLGKVTASGTVDLGNNGELFGPALEISPTGSVSGSGIIQADVMNSGNAFGTPGDEIIIRGKFTNNRRLDVSNSSRLKIEGDFVNNGVIAAGPENGPAFSGSVVNNGIIRLTRGAKLLSAGSFINNGVIDLMTGDPALPANFVNNGLVIDRSSVVLHSHELAEDLFRLRVQGETGHLYQLQYSDSLESETWVNTGDPVEGASGEIHTFAGPLNSPGQSRFYRVIVDP